MQVSTPVWLVGMMGAGKSSVGQALAQRLGCGFVDTDREIERGAHQSIAEIFAAQGEARFRELERAAVSAVAQGHAEPVVALGGGAIADPLTSAVLRETGTIVYLRARPETLLARVGDAEARPLLAGLAEAERLARLRALLAEREPAYAQASVIVDTDESSLGGVVETIVQALRQGE